MEIIKAKADFLQPYAGLKNPKEVQLQQGEDIKDYLEKKFPNLPEIERMRKVFIDVLKFKKDEIYIVARDLRDSIQPQTIYENTKVKKFPKMYLGYEDLNNKSIVFFNLFALGDSLMFTPLYKRLKELYPSCKIIVETRSNYTLLKNNPYIDKLIFTPVLYDDIKDYDYFVDAYEQVNSYPYNNLRLIDFWATQLKLDLKEKYPIIGKPKNVAKWQKIINDIKKETGKKIIMLHGSASSIHRSIPFSKFIELMKKYEKDYAFITIYPKYNQFDLDDYKAEMLQFENFYNLSKYSESIDDLASVIYTLDATNDFIISADTVVPHIAASYKKTCFVIAGGVAPEAQHYYISNYFPYVFPIYNNGFIGQKCSGNCHIHASPTPCPEALARNQQYSPCIVNHDASNIQKIINNIQIFLNNNNKEELENHYAYDNCPICKNKSELYLIDIHGEIYYCNNCKTRFRKQKIDVNIPSTNIKSFSNKGKNLYEVLYTMKEGLVYTFLFDKIRYINKIALIDEVPGTIYYIIKTLLNKENTTLYRTNKDLPFPTELENEIIDVNATDDIKDKYDLIFVDFVSYAYSKNPELINKQFKHLANKLNEDGMLIILAQNANRPNVFMQRSIDTDLLFTTGIPNIEISKDTIKEIFKHEEKFKIYTISKSRFDDALIAGSKLTFDALLSVLQQNIGIVEYLYNNNIKPLLDFNDNNMLSLFIITKKHFNALDLYATNIKIEKIIQDINRYNYINTNLIEH